MTTTPTTTPVTPEPRKTHHVRTALLATGGGLVALTVLGGVLSSGTSKTAAPAPKPAVTVTHTVQAPAPKPAAPDPAPKPAGPDQILYRFSGTGIKNTTPFTAPADGNWHLSWAYTNGALFAGQPENFAVTEYNTDGTIDTAGGVLVNALAVGTGQPTATPVYGDPGTHYFSVNTEDASWELVVVSGTS